MRPAAVVFDLGGTLMEYKGMPLSWSERYPKAFRHVSNALNLNLTDQQIIRSSEILTGYNPRISGRETEYTPEFLFREATFHWEKSIPMPELIARFWEGVPLRPKIFPDTIPVLKKLKGLGMPIAAFTDLPSAMPDERFRTDINPILELLDFYVSSQSSGYRKPNPAGLVQIAHHFGVDMGDLVFIGDEAKDAAAAQNGGCCFIAICRTGEGGSLSSLNDLLVFMENRQLNDM